MKMRFILKAAFTVTVVSMLYSAPLLAADDSLVAWWKFNRNQETTVVDSATDIEDEILGNFKNRFMAASEYRGVLKSF